MYPYQIIISTLSALIVMGYSFILFIPTTQCCIGEGVERQ